jgi:polysaccharide biosynthesis protein PelF
MRERDAVELATPVAAADHRWSAMAGVGPSRSRPVRVMLLSEGTYPFFFGGVSTWCDTLITQMPWVDFAVMSIVSDPRLEPVFTFPDNVIDFRTVTLWGTRERLETRRDLGLIALSQRRRCTTEASIEQDFLPAYEGFLRGILAGGDVMELACDIHTMHRYCLEHDFDTAMRSAGAWDRYLQVVQRLVPPTLAGHGYPDTSLSLKELTTGMQWLYRWMFPLAAPLPEVDVVHAAMPGASTLVAVAAKLGQGSGFLLTEHGIYLRERYLDASKSDGSLFLKLLDLRFARRMTELGYALADTISPCADYNQRWERHNGARPEQLRTIYYGLDGAAFEPAWKPIGDPPVVVWVGRVNPLKGLETLIYAASEVHRVRPDVEFRLFGSPPAGDEPYADYCLALRSELGLDDVVRFMGYTDDPRAAYNQGDIVVMSSISEGFPYSILEAMLCGKPIVSTAVGGIPEQIEGCGTTVEPRDAHGLAAAIVELFEDPVRCERLGRAARSRALTEFSLRRCVVGHYTEYLRLANWVEELEALLAGDGPEPLPEEPLEVVIELDAPAHALVPAAAQGAACGPSTAACDPPPAATTSSGSTTAAWNGDLRARRNGSTPVSGDADLPRLVAEVEAAVPQPLESLEVTAVLESMGMSDAAARTRFGLPDVFVLAERVMGQLPQRPAGSLMDDVEPVRHPHLVSRSLVLAAPGVLLLLVVSVYALMSGWGSGRITAFGVGLSGGVLVAGGLVQGANHRASVHLGFDDVPSARRFLLLSLPAVWTATTLLAVSGTLIATQSGVLSPADGTVFALAFVGASTLWIAATGLSLRQQTGWLAIGLLAGVATLVVVGTLLAGRSDQLAWASGAGFVAAITVVAIASQRALRMPSDPTRPVLPPTAFLVHEATPYATYGVLYSALVFAPHAAGWVTATFSVDNGPTFVQFELGLLLALLPLLVATGVAERAIREFWVFGARRQLRTDGLHPAGFSRDLQALFRDSLRRYAITMVATATGVCFVVVKSVLGDLPAPDTIADPGLVAPLLAGSVGYCALGLGQFSATFLLSLARPRVAVNAAATGLLVMFGTSALLFDLGTTGALVAFPLGAAAFAASSLIGVTTLLRRADHAYVAAV